MKKSIMFIIALASISSLYSKSWIVKVENNDYKPVTVQSNDASARNSTLDAAGVWKANGTNPITIEPGKQLAFNDFVIGWKTFGSKVTITTSRGAYTLQEDRNMIFETSPDDGSEKRILERDGLQDRTVKVIINSDGTIRTEATS